MDTGYILIASAFVGLAIAYNLWGRLRSKTQRPRRPTGLQIWVTRELYRGDLRALSDAARGFYDDVGIDQLDRLRDRGFVATGVMGRARVTIKGRLALLLRGTIARAAETA